MDSGKNDSRCNLILEYRIPLPVTYLIHKDSDTSVRALASQKNAEQMEFQTVSQNSPCLLDRMRAENRLRHYSLRTEQAYVDWARRYILFHNKQHPDTLGAEAVRDFLSHLASDRKVSPSTQNQVKSALLFLY